MDEITARVISDTARMQLGSQVMDAFGRGIMHPNVNSLPGHMQGLFSNAATLAAEHGIGFRGAVAGKQFIRLGRASRLMDDSHDIYGAGINGENFVLTHIA